MLSDVEGKRVIVVGLGRQGIAAARWLAGQGAQVVVTDRRDREDLAAQVAEIEAFAPEFALGGHSLELLEGADLLCVSGGVPLSIPFIQAARARDIPLTTEAQFFLERCPAPIIGITGSAGKSTTTALVGAMCRATDKPSWVGGNFGNPLLNDLDQIGSEDWVVMELSSFQLDLMTGSPRVGAVLNLSPNHLDRHGSMEAYKEAKAHILQHQRVGDIAVLNFDDVGAHLMTAYVQGELWWYSMDKPMGLGAYLDDGEIILARPGEAPVTICSRGAVQLRGDHNLRNVIGACTIAGAAGVPPEAICSGVGSFTGIPHRLEEVARIGGVTWVNDSIATTPERAIAALRSYDEPIVLLAGGRDKDLPWQEFAQEVIERVRRLICFGEAGPLIMRHVTYATMRAGDTGRLEAFDAVANLAEAVERAAGIVQPGEVVLLAPGGTSYDDYPDFVARGEHFKALVAQLPGEREM